MDDKYVNLCHFSLCSAAEHTFTFSNCNGFSSSQHKIYLVAVLELSITSHDLPQQMEMNLLYYDALLYTKG